MAISEINKANMENAGMSTNKVTGAPPVSHVENVERQQQQVKKSTANNFSKEEVKEMVESLQEMSELVNTRLNFSISEDTEDVVVKVIDRETDEVIRQIPPEEIVELQKRMKELTGMLIHENA